MSAYEIPLYGPGWNNVAYPLLASRPVIQALLSIAGYYTTVYGYEAASATWRMYDVEAEPYANDLTALQFGQGYWIQVSSAITLYIGGATPARFPNLVGVTSPPSTFYGPVLSGPGFAPAAGMRTAATVDGRLCASGETQLYAGEVVYVLHVLADGPGGAAGCGQRGDEIVFEVAGQVMASHAVWNNDHVRRLPLEPGNAAPWFTSAPEVAATQDVPYTYTVTATDPGLGYGDALTITARTRPDWLTLVDHGNGTATLFGTPTVAGDYSVVLRVTDGAGLFAEQSFSITVAAEGPRFCIYLPSVSRNAG
jgi:hypothetical protein